MKIITTKKYAQLNSLPGDPGLPPGIDNRMIEENAGFEKDLDRRGEKGFLEINIDWDQLLSSHMDLGYDASPSMEAVSGNVPAKIDYTFDYVQGYDGISYPENIRITQAIIIFNNTKINVDDEDLLYRLKEDYEDLIKEDIKRDVSDVDLY